MQHELGLGGKKSTDPNFRSRSGSMVRKSRLVGAGVPVDAEEERRPESLVAEEELVGTLPDLGGAARWRGVAGRHRS